MIEVEVYSRDGTIQGLWVVGCGLWDNKNGTKCLG